MVLAAVTALTLAYSNTAAATNHAASRSFTEPSVMPGGELVVTITASDYGPFAQVVETLPLGFSFVDSSLEVGVEIGEQTVSFILLGEETFTYTVTAPSVEDTYTFSGVLMDSYMVEEEIGGASNVTAGTLPPPAPVPPPPLGPEPLPPDPSPPTPTPEPSTPTPEPSTPTPEPSTPTPEPPTSTPEPPTSTPEPPTPTPEPPTPTREPSTPTATATPAPTPEPPTPMPEPPTPTPTATATPAPTPEPPTEEEGGITAWLIALIVVGAVLVIGAVALVILRRRR